MHQGAAECPEIGGLSGWNVEELLRSSQGVVYGRVARRVLGHERFTEIDNCNFLLD